uniref:RT_RNaseH domain-containing protein n=1 Tax=Rhodnius prolixus TaxID=13249 RepID=T1HF72_RHOPR
MSTLTPLSSLSASTTRTTPPPCWVLSKAELNYSMIHKEALAIFWSVNKFYQYLAGNQFTLYYDNKPLLALFGEHKGLPEMAAGRLQRWALYLSGFNYTMKYISSQKNVADGFSRLPVVDKEPDSEQKDEIDYINMMESALSINF